MATAQTKPVRSPYPSWLLSAASMYGTYVTWGMGQAGNDLACAGSALLAPLAAKYFWRGLVAHDERQILRRLHRASRKRSNVHGGARWATRKDIRRASMRKKGIFLGRFAGRDLYYPGENSLLAIAPPGAGKTTCLAIQHLLRSRLSTIVLDPKLELFAVTHKARRRMGHRVLVISPWYEEFARQFGGRVPTWDDGFDPCSALNPNVRSVIDDCHMLASLLLPEPEKGADETEEFFRDFSSSILVAFMLLELSRCGRVTLPRLRQMIMAPEERVEADIAQMMTSSAFSGVLAEYGARLYSPKVNSGKEWSGGLSGAMKALRLYDAHGPVGQSVEKAGVDFSTFKNEPTTIYIGQPSDKVLTHKGWAGMVITLAMEMLARDRRKKPCVFLVDECQNLGAHVLTQILKGVALYRGSGLQWVLLVQFLPALKRLVGESWREFLSVDLVTAFGAPSDPETLDILSRLSGQCTVQDVNYSSDASVLADGQLGVGMGAREVARPLLRSEEIRMLPKDEQLIFTGNLPPIRAKKQSYLNVPWLRRRAEENPYYV